MKRVTGLGGIFFKAKDSQKMKEWYDRHLGIPSGPHGGHFEWRDFEDPDKKGITAWSILKENTDYFDPSSQAYMINYRVENLEWLLERLREEGVETTGDIQFESYGKFAWIFDPEGNKIELWEPADIPHPG